MPRTWGSRDTFLHQRKTFKDRHRRHKQEHLYYSKSHSTLWRGGWWQPRWEAECLRLKVGGLCRPKGSLASQHLLRTWGECSRNWIKRMSLIKYEALNIKLVTLEVYSWNGSYNLMVTRIRLNIAILEFPKNTVIHRERTMWLLHRHHWVAFILHDFFSS